MALALPDGRRGRMMALGLTVAVIGLVWVGVVQPATDSFANGADTLERRTALAQRMSDVSESLPLLRAQAKASVSAGPPVNATLDGSTDSIAGANLQSRVEGMAATAGAHLTSTEALPAEPVGDYRRISLRVSVDATWVVLIRLLQAIEHATPRMFIDDLQLHAQPTATRVRELPLDISFTVLAFRPTVVIEPASPTPRTSPPDAGAISAGPADQAPLAVSPAAAAAAALTPPPPDPVAAPAPAPPSPAPAGAPP